MCPSSPPRGRATRPAARLAHGRCRRLGQGRGDAQGDRRGGGEGDAFGHEVDVGVNAHRCVTYHRAVATCELGEMVGQPPRQRGGGHPGKAENAHALLHRHGTLPGDVDEPSAVGLLEGGALRVVDLRRHRRVVVDERGELRGHARISVPQRARGRSRPWPRARVSAQCDAGREASEKMSPLQGGTPRPGP